MLFRKGKLKEREITAASRSCACQKKTKRYHICMWRQIDPKIKKKAKHLMTDDDDELMIKLYACILYLWHWLWDKIDWVEEEEEKQCQFPEQAYTLHPLLWINPFFFIWILATHHYSSYHLYSIYLYLFIYMSSVHIYIYINK